MIRDAAETVSSIHTPQTGPLPAVRTSTSWMPAADNDGEPSGTNGVIPGRTYCATQGPGDLIVVAEATYALGSAAEYVHWRAVAVAARAAELGLTTSLVTHGSSKEVLTVASRRDLQSEDALTRKLKSAAPLKAQATLNALVEQNLVDIQLAQRGHKTIPVYTATPRGEALAELLDRGIKWPVALRRTEDLRDACRAPGNFSYTHYIALQQLPSRAEIPFSRLLRRMPDAITGAKLQNGLTELEAGRLVETRMEPRRDGTLYSVIRLTGSGRDLRSYLKSAAF